jgi:hypothetical protein
MLYASLRREIQTIRQQELYLENQGSYPKTCLEPFFTVIKVELVAVSFPPIYSQNSKNL